MPYTFQELLAENERLKEELMRLRHELEAVRGGEEMVERLREARPGVIIIAGRQKGTGARYAAQIVRLNMHHRRLLFYLTAEGAVDEVTSVPMVHLKRKYRLPTGPTAGRMAELIGKGYVKCRRVPITFQPDSEGVFQYRPETELDPAIGVKKRRKFTYWLTQSGREALLREVKPTDDFVRAMPQLDVLLELREKVEKTEV